MEKLLDILNRANQLHQQQSKSFWQEWNQKIPQEAQLATAFVAGLCVGLLIPRIRQPFRRFLVVDDIPSSFFQQERRIHAVAASVSDGDTFRARHLPFLRGRGTMEGQKLSESTLQIRLAGIDTPETAKFGNAGQPYGDEAKAWLEQALGKRRLTLTLLHRDQYSRAVCMVHYGIWPFRRNASEELLKKGLACVYRQTGAVYGDRLEVFEKLEAQAQKRKLNMWSQGKKYQSAKDYKAQLRDAQNNG